MSVTYCECVFVALGIQHEMRVLHTVVCGLPGCKYSATLYHKRHDFLKKKKPLLDIESVF